MLFKEIYDLFSNCKERHRDISLKMRLAAAINKIEGNDDSLKNGILDVFGVSNYEFEVKLDNMDLQDVIHTLNKVCVYQQKEINNLKDIIRCMSDTDNYNQYGRLDLDRINNLLDKEL